VMRLCDSHDCTEWAQWRIAGKNGDGANISFNKCQAHKIELMAHPILQEQRAIFAGAMPDLARTK
jgi:hypothetical protein